MTRPKLLLADDSITIRNVVEQTFADEGFDVTTATNGEEALAKLANVLPDIVILDVDMPEPTGYAICEQIKRDERTQHIPVLLIVGSFEPFDQTEAERVGADGYLTKPFQSIRDLITRVDDLLGPRESPASAAETSDIDSLYESSFSDENGEADEPDIQVILGDPGMDDEMIETSYPSPKGAVADEILVTSNLAAPRVESTVDLRDGAEPENGVAGASHTMSGDEPSTEFVEIVARRVVEKLSDSIIREIAKKEVPRIAEKLIRETLKEKNR